MESTAENRKAFNLALAWILGWTLLRMLMASRFQLTPDEANYWQWGRHLAWGYYDQAPLIGWAIGLSTRVLGNTEFAVRLPTILAMAVASLYMIFLARRFFGARAALFTALLSQGIFEFNVGGLLSTADGVQAAAWAGCAYHAAAAYDRGRWRDWLACGLWFGFGLLSKYTMVILAPGILAFGLFSPEHRARLKTVRPYAGFVLGCLLFSPVLYWNAVNGWNSARHVAYIGGAGEQAALHVKYLGEHLGAQAALLNPLVFILVLWAWGAALLRKYAPRRWEVPFILWTSIPMFAGFTLLSLHSRIYGNWPGASYITASVLVTAFFAPRGEDAGIESPRPRPRFFIASLVVGYLMTVIILAQTVFQVFPIPPKLDRTARELLGWREMGETAWKLKEAMPRPDETFLFGIRYQESSELAFYAPGNPETVSINRWSRPNVYDSWFDDEDLLGMDAVGAAREGNLDEAILTQVFERVDPPIPLVVTRQTLIPASEPQEVKTIYLYRAYGFKGGLRFVPWDPGDIRVGR